MKALQREMVAEAFALSNTRGAELLARLGDFSVWRGDLATMRGDVPRAADADVAVPPMRARDTLVLARAIGFLDPACRAALAAAYSGSASSGALPEVITSCEQRLAAIYESLSEREHAGMGSSRRR